jgi:hypothetical protein
MEDSAESIILVGEVFSIPKLELYIPSTVGYVFPAAVQLSQGDI